MAKKIYISPSSQTGNRYAVGNTTEAAQCRKIALALVKALARCGFEAKTNITGDMYARVKESNAWGADAHIPIHTNAFDGKVAGFRGFCYSQTGSGYKLVRAIMNAVAPITPGKSDGISGQPGLYEVKASTAPCAYLEIGFHDNKEEAQWIIDHTEEIAEAICKGVCNHYGVKYVAKAVTPAPAPKPSTGKLYRVFNKDGKQVGAFSVEANAFNEVRKQLTAAGTAKITLSGR